MDGYLVQHCEGNFWVVLVLGRECSFWFSVAKREYPRFLKRFTSYVIEQTRDKPILFWFDLFLTNFFRFIFVFLSQSYFTFKWMFKLSFPASRCSFPFFFYLLVIAVFSLHISTHIQHLMMMWKVFFFFFVWQTPFIQKYSPTIDARKKMIARNRW